ncbi:MAG: hypothetical protein WCL23_02310, partial [Candidatus Moraniibacteriota bacterium]
MASDMTKYVTQKIGKKFIIFLVAIIGAGMLMGWQGILRPVFAQSLDQIGVSLSVFDAKNETVNGTFQMRFAIYDTDRTDPNAKDTAGKLWEETKQIDVVGGIIRTSLGDTAALPPDLFSDSSKDYYLGIRIGTDSEMVPRKKITSVPSASNALGALSAIDAKTLAGKVVGTGAGNIPLLGSSGKFALNLLPTGTGTNQLVLGNDGRLHSQNTDTGTDQNTFTLGSGTSLGATNFDLSVSNASVKPTLRYDSTTGTWQLSNDGSTFNQILTGSIANAAADGSTKGVA